MFGPDHPLRRTVRAVRRAHSSPAKVWQRALPHELEVWKRYIESGGGDFPDDFRARLDPRGPIVDPLLLEVLAAIETDEVRILDVGAGPLTGVGKVDPRRPTRRIEIVAVDPLADGYQRLLAGAGLTAPVPTQACRGEDVARRFGTGAFDIAYARNAVDHSAEAITVIESMLDAVRVGGTVLLHHYRREAELMRYEQLHQWNFDVQDGRLVLFNRRGRVDVAARLDHRATVAARVHGGSFHGDWVAATIIRTAW
jgi:SAM-dependent methyltransferase